MAETKMISERAGVLRERAAFINGVVCAERARECASASRAKRFISDGKDPKDLDGIAAREYPLPKIERPRIVVDCENAGVKWRYVAGSFEIFGSVRMEEEWTDDLGSWAPTPRRVALWADLLANPTELVDDDGVTP